MFTNTFDPVSVRLFAVDVRRYLSAYIFGILFGWFYCKRFLIKNKVISTLFDDLLTYLIIGIIIGGRVGYILFYNLKYYLNNLVEIFFIWEGGMSFHGALIGICISLFILSINNQIKFFKLTDFLVIFIPIGLFLGRVGNFINSELFGAPTYSNWGVIFPRVDMIPRHPSMLYEAFLEGLLLFVILLFIKKNKPDTGVLTSSFLIFYAFFRFCVELVRVPDSHIGYLYSGWLTMGMILSVPMFFVGILIYYYSKKGKI